MQYSSFAEYLATLPSDTVFRLWEKKFVFTPYEHEKKFVDQSVYENETCEFVVIKDVINLPDGDLLLATESIDCKGYTDYFKLSGVAIAKWDRDMEDKE